MAGQSKLLKANATRELGANVVFNYTDLQKQCDDYLENIRKQAAQIIADAQKQADQIRSVALRDGSIEGYSQGIQKADDEIHRRTEENTKNQVELQIQTIIPAVENISRLLQSEKENWISDWEKSAIQLVVSVAEKVVNKKLECQSELAEEMIRNALELAAGQREIIVSVNPRDAKILGENSQKIISVLAGCGEAEIREDESITPGGCLIESRQGQIDARLETQMERIASELMALDE